MTEHDSCVTAHVWISLPTFRWMAFLTDVRGPSPPIERWLHLPFG